MAKRVLVINIGWEQEPLIKLLINKGHELYGITSNIKNVNITDQYFKKIFQSDYRDLDKIFNIAKTINPDAVVSDQCDYSHFAQSYLAERLGLKGPNLANAQISANKFVQRQTAKKHGVLIPQFTIVYNYNEAVNACQEIGFPVIIKPIDNRGSFGVSKVNNIQELHNCYYTAIANSNSRFVLIEEFINGYEITVDGYCFEGEPKSLTVAKKSKDGCESQVSMDIKYPAEIPDDIYTKALKNNEFVNKVLGYSFGMTHSEYMVTDNGLIYLIESANRGGGVFTSEIIVPNVSGVNILERYIDDIFGEKSNIITPDILEKNEVILKFFSFSPGKIKNIIGIDRVIQERGVLKCRLNVKIGDEIQPISNDGNRHGFIIFKSQTEIRKKVENIIKKISINYE